MPMDFALLIATFWFSFFSHMFSSLPPAPPGKFSARSSMVSGTA